MLHPPMQHLLAVIILIFICLISLPISQLSLTFGVGKGPLKPQQSNIYLKGIPERQNKMKGRKKCNGW